MSLIELLIHLHRSAVRGSIRDGILILEGEELTPDLAAAVEEHRGELTAMVQERPDLLGGPGDVRATRGQARLVLLDWYGAAGEANACAVYRIEDRDRGFDADRLLEILRALSVRHDALRLTFRPSGSSIVQRADGLDPELVVTRGPEDAVQPWLDAFARRPFDLRHGPVVRFGILQVAPSLRYLALAAHHAAIDEAGVRVLLADAAEAYASPPAPMAAVLALGTAPSFLEAIGTNVPAQEVPETAVERLADLLVGPVSAPGASAEPRAPLARVQATLQEREAEALRELGRSCGGSLVTAVVAATSLVLGARLDGGPIGLGLTVSGRSDANRSTVGMFMNTVIVRGCADPDQPFRAALRQAQTEILAALADQSLPFDTLVTRVARRIGARAGDVLALQLNWISGRDDFSLPGLSVRRLDPPPFVGVADLVLEGRRRRDGSFGLALSSRGGASHDDEADVVLRHICSVLERASGDPDATGAELLRPGAAESARLTTFERGPALDVAPRPVIERIARWADLDPERRAVTDRAGTWTYGELWARASRVACRLRDAGATDGTQVAHQLGRGAGSIAALIGVLAAGGSAVVIDPSLPEAEAAARRSAAGAQLAVADADVAAPIGMPTGTQAGLRPVADGAPAYVLFTSGSSGRPKGVVVGHRNVASFIAGMEQAFPLDGGDRVLVHTPMSFDVGLAEVLWPLACGSGLVLAPPDGRLGGQIDAMRTHGVTVLIGVPTVLSALVHHADAGHCSTLRLVFSIGEVLAPELAAALDTTWPHADVVNLYGPTETTVASTAHALRGGGADAVAGAIPIGRPLPGQWAAVLDAAGGRSRIGNPGELWIGGAGVALGYLDAAQTAVAFVDDATVPGGRRYRTGDRARWRPDGQLEFLGRVDGQVKVGGARIDPAEVEGVIAAHPSVLAVGVRSWTASTGRIRLAAFVVPRGDRTVDPTTIRTWVRQRLPAAFSPSHVQVVDRLPTTTSGKLDRASLPRVEAIRHPHRVPRTPTEQRLVDAIATVLGLDGVSVDDDFVELGGDSLAAVEIAEIAERDGWPLLPRQLVEFPSIAALAEAMDGHTHRDS